MNRGWSVSKPIAYYNEIDPFAAAWLRNLITAGLIAPGDVDERSITDVRANDLVGYAQCHFFAGIGGWSYALRLAGWPDDRPVWTGSCPCQPFSAAGAGRGIDDERHLWPELARLIGECSPAICFGEQVASAAGRSWLASVRSDLEGMGYGVGAADLCAAGAGAPHIRQRLFWVADAYHERRKGEHAQLRRNESERISSALLEVAGGGTPRGVANAMPAGRAERRTGAGVGSIARGRCAGGLVDPVRDGRVEGRRDTTGSVDADRARSADFHGHAGADDGAWSDVEWLPCADGVSRPVEPGTFPLADGVPGRVGLLRGYGNAIVPQVGAEFVMASMEAIDEVVSE